MGSRYGLGASGVGAAGVGIAAEETGNGNRHTTKLTFDITDAYTVANASLAVGYKIYTLPAGRIFVEDIMFSVALTSTDATILSDTPDMGIGSVIASGAVATLDGTSTFEDFLTGQTMNDCNGTVELATAAADLDIAAALARPLFLNLADGWGAGADFTINVAGTIIFNWISLD